MKLFLSFHEYKADFNLIPCFDKHGSNFCFNSLMPLPKYNIICMILKSYIIDLY